MFNPVQVGKRTRYSYARIKEVMKIPHLLDIQRNSYKWFIEEGLGEILRDISPISDFTGSLKLFFKSFKLGEPKYTLAECKERDGTYAAPIRVNVQLVNHGANDEVKEQEVFMGDFPLMTETGTFVINGAERVIVSQLVRSPGAYYDQTIDQTGKKIFTATVIPNRGAWIELETDAADSISVRIDRTRKMPVTYFLRALGFETDEQILELFGHNRIIREELEREVDVDTKDKALLEIYKRLRPGEPATPDSALQLLNSLFFDTKRYDLASVGRYKMTKKLGWKRRLINKTLADDIFDAETGEVLIEAGTVVNEDTLNAIDDEREAEIFGLIPDKNHRGFITPIQLKIKTDNDEDYTMLCAPTLDIKENRTVCVADIVSAIGYLMDLMNGMGHTDDIDHLGNRRVRSVGELLQNQFRVGMSRMERVVRERMTIQDSEMITPQNLINIRPVVAAIKEFFGSSQLSQFMDQHNPLSELTHKRRLSALGPGGLSRERAGFEVRDVHNSHYGRMCPIETPEGPNIGLIGSLSNYARVNQYGFMETPYRKVDQEHHKVTNEVRYMTADEEEVLTIAQANEPLDENDWFVNERVTARHREETTMVSREKVNYMDVSPKQVVSIATAMIPFLENDDANRALMGANMQRQAVPLLKTQAPLVGTGMEFKAACDSGVMVLAEHSGTVTKVDAGMIKIKPSPIDLYHVYLPETKNFDFVVGKDDSKEKIVESQILAQFDKLNIKAKRPGTLTDPDRVPVYVKSDKVICVKVDSELTTDEYHVKDYTVCVTKGDVVGKNSVIAKGKNNSSIEAKRSGVCIYADDDLVKIESDLMYSTYVFVSDKSGDFDIVKKGAEIKKGGYLLKEKETDKNKEQKAKEPYGIRAKFSGKVVSVQSDPYPVICVEDYRSDIYNLQKFVRSNQGTCINQTPLVDKGDFVEKDQPIADGPSTDHGELALGYNIIVAYMPWEGYNYEDAILLSENLLKRDIYTSIHIEEYQCDARDTKLGPEEVTQDIPNVSDDLLAHLDSDGIITVGADVRPGDILVGKVTPKGETELTAEERLLRAIFGEKAREVRDTSLRVPHGESGKVVDVKVFTRDNNDEMGPGINKQVRVYIAQKRKISVGDKMSGRHGNKGVVSRIMREEDMPFLADGTPVDIVLNPLGVPSRMNIGQILETHLGMAVRKLGFEIKENPGAVAKKLEQLGYDTKKNGMPKSGKAGMYISTPVFDGAKESDIINTIKLAGLDDDGKTVLYDGRTGEPFENRVTVGCVYMLKLHHLVDDKIHARSTGPYSLVTQQPLGGKAQFGGQRFGEMEVWALEAYGASYTLQEILTVKSDDVVGRVKAYEAIVKGNNIPEPGVPESFKVLIKELQSIGLDIKVLSGDAKEIVINDEEDDDDKTIRNTAEELGVDIGNHGKHEVPVPPQPEEESIIAEGIDADSEMDDNKEIEPTDEDIFKTEEDFKVDEKDMEMFNRKMRKQLELDDKFDNLEIPDEDDLNFDSNLTDSFSDFGNYGDNDDDM